jgi:hypothetical protein
VGESVTDKRESTKYDECSGDCAGERHKQPCNQFKAQLVIVYKYAKEKVHDCKLSVLGMILTM